MNPHTVMHATDPAPPALTRDDALFHSHTGSATDDIGDRVEPLGVAAMLVEAALLALAVLVLTQLPPWRSVSR